MGEIHLLHMSTERTQTRNSEQIWGEANRGKPKILEVHARHP